MKSAAIVYGLLLAVVVGVFAWIGWTNKNKGDDEYDD